MVMLFMSEKALKHLLRNGVVVTFRAKRRNLSMVVDWITDCRGGSKIADAVIEEIAHCRLYREDGYITYSLDSEEIREHYGNLTVPISFWLTHSGFSNSDEWLEEIKRLNKGRLPEEGWLYKVELLLPNCPRCRSLMKPAGGLRVGDGGKQLKPVFACSRCGYRSV